MCGCGGRVSDLSRYFSDVDGELVPVGRVDADRQPDGHALLVERGAAGLDDGDAAVFWKPEERRFHVVRCSHRDGVTVAGLLDAQCPPEVFDGALGDIARLDEPGGLLRETHRVEGGL